MSQILLRPAHQAAEGAPQQTAAPAPAPAMDCRLVRLQAEGTGASGPQDSTADLSARAPQSARNGGAAPGSARIAKELVHLSFDDAVHLTGCEQQDPTHFTLTGSWPAHTTHHVPGHGTHYETLTVAQTIRQTGLFLAHTVFEAPLDHATLLNTFSYTLNPHAAAGSGGETPFRIDVTATPSAPRTPHITALHLHMTISSVEPAAGPGAASGEASGTVLVTGETTFEWIPPAVFRRIRGEYHKPPTTPPPLTPYLPPAQVGRTRPDEVLLSPTDRPREWHLRHPWDNKLLYDHAVDHVPGLVLIEAAGQAAYTTTAPLAGTGGPGAGSCGCAPTAPGSGYRPQPVTTHTTFHRYTEFDTPVTLTIDTRTTAHTTTRTTTGHQNGRPVFTTTHTTPATPVDD
ncbi:ScbA/BarX family gamma-butyrolactone biosynthesis protein [Streptomyces sp. NPDC008001]|uniref:ScbA/BarX family gamma-butyrolactone biosynthesis protein n=1 Tax=Streptomyces sp. NPDC008001 TaxID=3364804 RepID=UPI0036EF0F8C